MSHSLRVIPLADAGGHLLQEELVVLQDLGNLVEHVVHQQGVHDGAAVGLFEGTHVALQGRRHQFISAPCVSDGQLYKDPELQWDRVQDTLSKIQI